MEYDGRLIDEIEKLGIEVPFPYHPASYEEYYGELDTLMNQYPEAKDLILKYKNSLLMLNDKTKWGIVRYHGESNIAFTKGRYYYVPIYESDGHLVSSGGVIDDEEFTSYLAFDFSGKPRDTTDMGDDVIINEQINFVTQGFEIIVDPDGVLAAEGSGKVWHTH